MQEVEETENAQYKKWRKIALLTSLIPGLILFVALVVGQIYLIIWVNNEASDVYDVVGFHLVSQGIIFSLVCVAIPVLVVSCLSWRWPLVGAIIWLLFTCFLIVTSVTYHILLIFVVVFFVSSVANIQVIRAKKRFSKSTV